jgi:hypothetical protein
VTDLPGNRKALVCSREPAHFATYLATRMEGFDLFIKAFGIIGRGIECLAAMPVHKTADAQPRRSQRLLPPHVIPPSAPKGPTEFQRLVAHMQESST